MPSVVLSAVVFLIGSRLIDVSGFREVYPAATATNSGSLRLGGNGRLRGVEQGILGGNCNLGPSPTWESAITPQPASRQTWVLPKLRPGREINSLHNFLNLPTCPDRSPCSAFLLLSSRAILGLFRSWQDLLMDNLALRQQLGAFKSRNRRPKLVALDELFGLRLEKVLLIGRSGNVGPLASWRMSTLLELGLQG